jgi:adenylosuccinate lyase
MAHTSIALQATLKGLSKLQLHEDSLEADLARNWEVLAEPIQTVMRRYGIEQPYEKLKALTRGQKITAEHLQAFIESLALPEEARVALLALTPRSYTGYAADLARQLAAKSIE